MHSRVEARAGAGCPQQCEAADLRQATVSSITEATSFEGAAVERQVPEGAALPRYPQAREYAGAAAGYSLAQVGAGDEFSVPAGAVLVQKSATADPESELVLEHTTSYGYPQARESATENSSTVSGLEQAAERVWTIGNLKTIQEAELQQQSSVWHLSVHGLLAVM